MASYEVRWKASAVKDLKKIEPKRIPRIIESVESLRMDPFPSGSHKLRKTERIYRIRIGEYRLLYEVDTQAKKIIIYYIRHRREAYRIRI